MIMVYTGFRIVAAVVGHINMRVGEVKYFDPG